MKQKIDGQVTSESFQSWYNAQKAEANPKLQVAIKKMEVTKKNRKYIINEIMNQREVSAHPNIVKYIESYFGDNLLWVWIPIH